MKSNENRRARRTTAIGVITVVLSITAFARAGTIPWVQSRQLTSVGISGFRGTPGVTGLPSPTNYQFEWENRTDLTYTLRGVAFKEASGALCHYEALERSVYYSNGELFDSQWGPRFRGNNNTAERLGPCSDRSAYAGLPIRSVEVPGRSFFIRGIEVCTSDRRAETNTSIRGVRLTMAEVQGERLVPVGVREQMVLDGCERWHPPAMCPAGHIATAVVGHYGSGPAYRGLELYCSPLSRPQSASRSDRGDVWITEMESAPQRPSGARPARR